jgi:hypothetical protein
MPAPSTTTSAFSSDIDFPTTVTAGFHIVTRPPMTGIDGMTEPQRPWQEIELAEGRRMARHSE